MRNKQLFFISLLLLSVFSIRAQTNLHPSKPNSPAKQGPVFTNPQAGKTNPVSNPSSSSNPFRIKWMAPQTIDLLNDQSRKAIYFEGANYDENFHPVYLYRKALSSNEHSVKAVLVNPEFEVLDPASQSMVNKKAIPNVISLRTVVAYDRKKPVAEVTFVPLRINPITGQLEKLVSFGLSLIPDESKRSVNPTVQRTYASSSVLSSGTWYRFGVPASGIYKISYQYLKSLGIDMTRLDPTKVRLFGNGGGTLPYLNSAFRYDDLVENAIYFKGGNQTFMDTSDYILFYGQSPHTWSYNPANCPKFNHTLNKYSDTTFYFLCIDMPGTPKRITSIPNLTVSPTNQVTTFDDYSFSENDAINLIASGREWYGDVFDIITSYNYPFNFPNIDVTSQVSAKADLVARGDGVTSYFNISCQTTNTTFTVSPVSYATYWLDYALPGNACISFLPASSSLSVNVTKQSPSTSTGWMNYVEVNARRQLIMNGNQMAFRDVNSVGPGNISQFTVRGVSSKMLVWDITDFKNVGSQSYQYNSSNNSLTFEIHNDSLREFMVFDSTLTNTFPSPTYFGPVPNQNLHASAQVDYIIVAHPMFLAQAYRLANLHQARENISYTVVTPQQIYNEFSSGKQDPTAIRGFVKMLYDRATGGNGPKYLLLFGNGTYDPKHRTQGSPNLVVTFENANSTNYSDSYVSDEFFGLLDDPEGNWDTGSDVGYADIGVGRFPVTANEQATGIVDKIEKYMSLGSPPPVTGCNLLGCSVMRDWRNWVCFMADDGDGGVHVNQAEALSQMVDTAYHSYNIDKIYLDAYQEEMTPGGGRYPTVTAAVDARVDKGALIFNYTGHGGEVGLSHKRVVEVDEINGWSNLCNMPLFVTATCEFSRFDNPLIVSAGELILLNPNGGGIGLLTTVRLVYSQPNFNLNQNFYRCVFKPIGGKMPRLGDVFRITKVTSGNATNNRNFTLLGDPAITLAYPDKKTSTTQINNVVLSTSTTVDTVQALSHVTVKGFVCDTLGNKLTGFNGTIYPTVFDKAFNLTTLSNDGVSISPPITFALQKNIIYKGKSSITNGDFQFSFVVPKDIAYQYGKGKISYYFENGVDDGNGNCQQIIVGGSSTSVHPDNIGPTVKLFMNDSTFQYGGSTDQNPHLYAVLFDSSGISTVGNGIGHDLVAVLDDNTSNPTVLNDYYTADLNTYRSGKVHYPYTSLSEGTHTLKMKVWDVYDNSSQSTTEFVVSSSANLALKHVLNYPNPFTTHTSFYFEDNECCQTLNVEIEIFTITGKLVKTIQMNMSTEGYRSPPIDWDGRDDFGDKIGRGVYIYKLTVRSQNGGSSQKLEKLVILN